MDVMMAVQVIGEDCKFCKRLSIEREIMYSGGKIVGNELSCIHYDACLNAVEMFRAEDLRRKASCSEKPNSSE